MKNMEKPNWADIADELQDLLLDRGVKAVNRLSAMRRDGLEERL
jgi:hypothetical protein